MQNDDWSIVDNINLPEAGIEVLGFNEKWVDEDFNPDGVCLCFLGDDRMWTVAVWCDSCDEWHTMYSKRWTDNEEQVVIEPPTHWKNKPKKPQL